MLLRQLPSPIPPPYLSLVFFFFNDTATTEIYTLSLHDALPISNCVQYGSACWSRTLYGRSFRDRKSTRLNSSHLGISYAVFCLKKKKKNTIQDESTTEATDHPPPPAPHAAP